MLFQKFTKSLIKNIKFRPEYLIWIYWKMRMTWRKVFICFIPVLAPGFLARFVGWFFLLAFCFFSICVGPRRGNYEGSINQFFQWHISNTFVHKSNKSEYEKSTPTLHLSLSPLSLSNQNTFKNIKKKIYGPGSKRRYNLQIMVK